MSLPSDALKDALDTQAVKNFREYLQIPSVQPNVNYGKLFFNISCILGRIFTRKYLFDGIKNAIEN